MEKNLTITPLTGVSKADIARASDNLVAQVVDEGIIDPLQALIRIRAYKQVIENAEKRIAERAVGEADKYSKVGSQFNAYGVSIQQKYTTKYDFKVCKCPALDVAEDRVKKIKEALKNASEETPFVDTETGEIYTTPADKISTETLAITFK